MNKPPTVPMDIWSTCNTTQRLWCIREYEKARPVAQRKPYQPTVKVKK